MSEFCRFWWSLASFVEFPPLCNSHCPVQTIHHFKYLAHSLANFKGLFPEMIPLCQIH